MNLKEGTWRTFDASRDLALGKVATASSEAGENVAKNVTAATTYADYAEKRWESAASDPQWVQVDLGSPMEVNRVILKWYAYAAKEFSVETSVDGETWKEVYHATAGSSFMVTDATFATTTARYVRMMGTERSPVMMGRRIGTGPAVGTGAATRPRPATRPRGEVAEPPGLHGYSLFAFEVLRD